MHRRRAPFVVCVLTASLFTFLLELLQVWKRSPIPRDLAQCRIYEARCAPATQISESATSIRRGNGCE